MAQTRLPPESWFPAGIEGITARQVTLPSGLALRVLEAGPTDGPPVLLLHGWAVTSYLWRKNILALASAGFRIVSADLPGHGLSDAPSAAGSYTLPAFTQSVLALMDTLGMSSAALIAQSMAGKVAVQCALDAPSRVSSLQLFGPVGFGELPPWKVFSPALPVIPGILPSLLVPRQVVAFVQQRVWGKIGWFTEHDIDEYWAPTQFPSVIRAQVQMLKEFDWAPWTQEALARVQVPTLVVFGTRDRTVRPVHAERLVKSLSRGRLEWIEDGGHVVMEEAPDRVNAMMIEALRFGR